MGKQSLTWAILCCDSNSADATLNPHAHTPTKAINSFQDAACGLFQKDTTRKQLLDKVLFQYTDCFPGTSVLNPFPQLPGSPPSQPAAGVLQVPGLGTGKVP